MLSAEGEAMEALFARAASVKSDTVGEKLYLRGLIEYSNVCRKNCLYCGIRRGNSEVCRYTLSEEQVLAAARTAVERRMGSVVIQAGEMDSPQHTDTIEKLIREIKSLSGGTLAITLSFGEQSEGTLKRWFDAGADRYLLRIEASSPGLYSAIHPDDGLHSYDTRVGTLRILRSIGYQVGTGVMIGLPGQSVDDLAGDICFMRDMDVDMCGMGPYIESENTPLTADGCAVPLPAVRLELSLKMVAVLRIVMPDINIASTTALSSLSPDGRLMAVRCGANVIMPNITPISVRRNYNLYDNKSADIDARFLDLNIAYGEWGDPLHFRK